MTKEQLAQELRQRQYTFRAIPREVLDNLPDDEIIDSYITCSICGYKQVEGQDLETAILLAKSAEHFLDICQSKH